VKTLIIGFLLVMFAARPTDTGPVRRRTGRDPAGNPSRVRIPWAQSWEAWSAASSLPQPLETGGGSPCITDRVGDVPVPEIVLDQPRIAAAIGQIVAGGM